MAELRIAGSVASAGFAAGLLSLLVSSPQTRRRVEAPAFEAQALRRAIDLTCARLTELAARTGGDGAAMGRDVSLCGNAAGDPKYLHAALITGLRSLSVTPAALARTKAAISRIDLFRNVR